MKSILTSLPLAALAYLLAPNHSLAFSPKVYSVIQLGEAGNNPIEIPEVPLPMKDESDSFPLRGRVKSLILENEKRAQRAAEPPKPKELSPRAERVRSLIKKRIENSPNAGLTDEELHEKLMEELSQDPRFLSARAINDREAELLSTRMAQWIEDNPVRARTMTDKERHDILYKGVIEELQNMPRAKRSASA